MKDTKSPEKLQNGRDARVSALAYQIWEEEGRPEGRSEVHWHLACEMIDAEEAAQEPLPSWLNKAEQPHKATDAAEIHPLKKKSAA